MTAKKKKNNKKAIEQRNLSVQSKSGWLHQIAFLDLALLLFFPPYLRGLFFAPDQERVLIFATLVFWLVFLCSWLQNDHKFLRGPLDYFAIALPIVYVISTFTAVNKGLAIDEVVKNILYFLTYWSTSRLIRNEKDAHKLLQVIYSSAIGVTLAGLATVTELIHINGGFFSGRIFSTFQYPNALASYLGAVLFIGMYLWFRSTDYTAGIGLAGQSSAASLPKWLSLSNLWNYIYACGNFLLLAVLLGTKSRGGLLVCGLVFMIYLAGLGAEGRLKVTLHIAFNGAAAYLCITKFIPLAIDKHYYAAWLWIMVGLLLAVVGQFVYSQGDRYLFIPWANNGRKFNLVFSSLFTLGVIGGGILCCTQQAILEKLSSFSFLLSALGRMYFIGDAVKMFSAKPWLGWGGGGWREAYHSFQNYFYSSNEVHSYYFQVGVETGLLGLLAVTGIWLSFIYVTYTIYRNNKENPVKRQLTLLLVAAFLVIGGHALIDFDLSLSALTLVLWNMFGIAAGISQYADHKSTKKQKTENNNPPLKLPLFAGSIAAILIFLGSFILLQANGCARQTTLFLQAGQLDKGLVYLQKAAMYNPFNPGYHVNLAQIYKEKGELSKSLAEARLAADLSPYNPACRVNLAEMGHIAGDYTMTVKEAEKAVRLSPYQRDWYEKLAERYFLIGYELLEKGHKKEAKTYLQKAAELPDRMKTIMDGLPDQYRKMWGKGPLLIPNEAILFYAGAAKYQLEEYDQAEKYLQGAVNSENNNIKGKALLWLALVADKKGQPTKAGEFLQLSGELINDAEAENNHIKKMPLLK